MELGKDGKKTSCIGSDRRDEIKKVTHKVTDARPFSNMANARPTQGTKRQLSLSPQKTYNKEHKTSTVPDCPAAGMELCLTKKRLVSIQDIGNLRGIGTETGNDLSQGHNWTGSIKGYELSRTESNMAAPIIKTNPAGIWT